MNQQLLEALECALGLAEALVSATATEGSMDYDRSRGWSEQRDDYCYAKRKARSLRAKIKGLKRRIDRANSVTRPVS